MAFLRMIRCPNCGRRTRRGAPCQWCGYPMMSGRPVKKQKAEPMDEKLEKARQEAREAKEKVRQEA